MYYLPSLTSSYCNPQYYFILSHWAITNPLVHIHILTTTLPEHTVYNDRLGSLTWHTAIFSHLLTSITYSLLCHYPVVILVYMWLQVSLIGLARVDSPHSFLVASSVILPTLQRLSSLTFHSFIKWLTSLRWKHHLKYTMYKLPGSQRFTSGLH